MERNSDIVVMSSYAPLLRQRQPRRHAMGHRPHRLRRPQQLRLAQLLRAGHLRQLLGDQILRIHSRHLQPAHLRVRHARLEASSSAPQARQCLLHRAIRPKSNSTAQLTYNPKPPSPPSARQPRRPQTSIHRSHPCRPSLHHHQQRCPHLHHTLPRYSIQVLDITTK